MRERAPQLFAVVAVFVLLQIGGAGQSTLRPTPAPLVTAENEDWYLAGEPILHAGHVYYPTGPNVFFNPREMVRTGDYLGVPLYTLTTIEPSSQVYAPLAGRLMKPYERRRTGDLAGTTGSTLPSAPVLGPYAPGPYEPLPTGIVRAPGPPGRAEPVLGTEYPVAVDTRPAAPPEPAPTAGEAPYPPPGPLVTARMPEGLDAIFVEYQGRRWFGGGSAVELDPARFTRIGDYRGFAVYRRDADESTIYIAVRRTAVVVAPFALRR